MMSFQSDLLCVWSDGINPATMPSQDVTSSWFHLRLRFHAPFKHPVLIISGSLCFVAFQIPFVPPIPSERERERERACHGVWSVTSWPVSKSPWDDLVWPWITHCLTLGVFPLNSFPAGTLTLMKSVLRFHRHSWALCSVFYFLF